MLRVVIPRGASPAATLILHGGKVFTVDEGGAVGRGDRDRGRSNLAVGADDEVLALASDATERVDLTGRVVTQALNDAHVHAAAPLPSHDLGLPFDPPVAQVLDAIRAAAAATPPGTWLGGTIDGAVFDDPAARRYALHQAAPQHPVLLMGWTTHGRLLNSAALRALDLDREREAQFLPAGSSRTAPVGSTPGPYTGTKASTSRPSAPRRPTTSRASPRSRRSLVEALSYGITSVQQMTMPYSIEKSVAVLTRAQVPLRWRLIDLPLQGVRGLRAGAGRAAAVERHRERRQVDRRRHARGALDGDARTASLMAAGLERPALPRARRSAHPRWPQRSRAASSSWVHAVGDRAIEKPPPSDGGGAGAAATARPYSHASSTATGCARDLRARVAALGIVVVQNPSHFTIVDLVDRRLGRRHSSARRFQPFRSLVEACSSNRIGLHDLLNPFLNILFAVTHPINPAEALTVEQAVIAYTVGSARAEFREQEKGALRPGLLADLAVLTQDIFTIAPEALPVTASDLTVIGGRIVYRRGDAPPCKGCPRASPRSRASAEDLRLARAEPSWPCPKRKPCRRRRSRARESQRRARGTRSRDGRAAAARAPRDRAARPHPFAGRW